MPHFQGPRVTSSHALERLKELGPGFYEFDLGECGRTESELPLEVRQSGEFYNHNSETGASPIAACPSPKALEFMLRQAGFRRTEIADPPADAYEQHRRGKRLVCIAYK